MQPLRLAVVLGTPLLAVVAVLVACGDDTVTPLPGGNTSTSSSGAPKGTSSGASTDDDDTQGDDDDDDDDTTGKDGGTGDADCKFAPSLHHTDAGFFCDFYDGGALSADAGGKKNCPTHTVCCNPGAVDSKFPPSFCSDEGTGVTACADGADKNGSVWTTGKGSAWECGAAANCGSQKCCAVSFDDAIAMDAGLINYNDTPAGSGAPPAACHAKTLFKVAGTRCQDDCDPKTAFETCSTNDKCSNGKACIPVSSGNDRDLGICPR